MATRMGSALAKKVGGSEGIRHFTSSSTLQRPTYLGEDVPGLKRIRAALAKKVEGSEGIRHLISFSTLQRPAHLAYNILGSLRYSRVSCQRSSPERR